MEELNQQLAEAQGFSGVKQLVAEAYQMSIGKTREEAKKNTNSMQELTDAMKKGSVKADKVFPYLAQLLKESSAKGVEQARKSSGAEEDRFWNRMAKGWENFTKGGGERGIATFWKDITGSIGKWWEDNSAALGKRFEGMVLWFTAIRASITESIQTLWTGEETSISQFLRDWIGLDLQGVRVFLINLFNGIKEISASIGKVLGLVTADGSINFAEFQTRVGGFFSGVKTAIESIVEMFRLLAGALQSFNTIGNMSPWQRLKAVALPWSNEGQQLRGAYLDVGKAAYTGGRSVGEAAGALGKLVTPSDTWLGVDKKSEMWTPYYGPKDGQSRVSTPYNIFPYNRTDELGRVLRPVTPEDALPTPSVTQKQSLDVNVNLTVSGDPESVKAFASQELKAKIAESVPDMVDYMIDEKWNYKLRSALVNGVKP